MSGGAAPKRTGDRWERQVVDYLVSRGYGYARRALGAGIPNDCGDIAGLPGWVLQCKAVRQIDLSGALDAAERQKTHARFEYAAVIFKRRQKPAGQAYVVMTLETFAAIAADRTRPGASPR